MAGKPNILIFMADQLTPFALGCYGGRAVPTPNIDQLAASGTRYDAAYCNSPLCTPARYAFMTGRYVSRYSGYDNAAYLPSTTPTFAHYLRRMGYQTALSGKMHFFGPDQLHGFEERLTTDIYPADFGWVPDWRRPDERIDLWYHNMSSVVQAGVAAISNQLSYDDEVGAMAQRAIYDYARSSDERPFCLVASFIHPHDPYAARQEYWDRVDEKAIELPKVSRPPRSENDPHSLRLEQAIALDAVVLDEAMIRKARRAYFANVAYIDDWLGRLRSTLVETGQADNTVILFLSDHGDMLGERGLWYKMSFFEGSARIPLILHQPDHGDSEICNQPVSQVDVLPTLLDLTRDGAGDDRPEIIDPLEGESLLSPGIAKRDYVASEYLAEGTGQPMLMLRHNYWKYCCCPNDPEQLFDLDQDPDELHNLADDPDLMELLETFRAWARAHWDAGAVRAEVLASQRRRRLLSEALRQGRYQNWDWQPPRNASQEYSRSHLDLTDFDANSRWPRPDPFTPKRR